MCDSSFEIERVLSEKEIPFDIVPKDIKFKIKWKNRDNKTYGFMEYVLLGGKSLPYSAVLKEKTVKFSRFLKPEVANMEFVSSIASENLFIFKDSGELPKSDEFETSPVGSGNSSSSSKFSKLEELIMSKKKKDKNSIAPFVCPYCPNMYISMKNAVQHVEALHPGLDMSESPTFIVGKEDVLAVCEGAMVEDEFDNSGLYDTSETLGGEDDLVVIEEKERLELTVHADGFDLTGDKNSISGAKRMIMVHSNPDWFNEMKTSFNDSVVARCTKRTRDAVEANEDIKDIADRRVVMNELINQTVTYLEGVFGSETPRQKNTKQVADLLGSVYPALFKDDGTCGSVPAYGGYGMGGLKGLKNLPERICDRFRDKLRKGKRSLDTSDMDSEEAVPAKKGKKKLVYGVNQKRFYVETNDKHGIEDLKLAGKIEDFEEREAVFDRNRSALMKIIRNSPKMISKACDGFFADATHLERMFSYLTDSDISKKIQRNLVGHLENLELYLVSVNSTVEFAESLEKVKDDCSLLFAESKVHKYIHLLRCAAEHWDQDGSAILRIDSDGSPKSSSPHIVAVKMGMCYVFELWVEKARILHNMDMAECIAAFLHLVFCFNLKYPKEAQTVCDFIQRVIADYGTDEGTKTHKPKATADTQLTKYHIQLGKVLGARNIKDV